MSIVRPQPCITEQGPGGLISLFWSCIDHHRSAELQHSVDIFDLLIGECDTANCPIPIFQRQLSALWATAVEHDVAARMLGETAEFAGRSILR